MPAKLRWGVLGVSSFAVAKVIPAMKHCELSEVAAIASRSLDKARTTAAALGIPRAYGSYEELLADPSIDVVYNPLPNHLHVPWSIRALEAGKHVLCEKPLGLSSAEVRSLIEARDRTGLRAGEAFMVRTHPQWLRAKQIVTSGELGRLRSVAAWFSYFNDDPSNVRNKPEYGGGGLMDIGCYAIFGARFLFGEEPLRASGVIDSDPAFSTDRLASAVLEFPSGHAVFTCGTQMAPAQRFVAICERAAVEIEIPFNAPPDRPCRICVNGREEFLPVCDQYTIQADAFSRAVRGEAQVPVPLEDSLNNLIVIEAILKSLQND